MITKFQLKQAREGLRKIFNGVGLTLDQVAAFGAIISVQCPSTSYGLDLLIDKDLTEHQKSLILKSFSDLFQESVTISTQASLTLRNGDKEAAIKAKKSLTQLCKEAESQEKAATAFKKKITEAKLDDVRKGSNPDEAQIKLLMSLNEESKQKSFQDVNDGIVDLLDKSQRDLLDYIDKWDLHKAAEEGYDDIVEYMLPFIPAEEIDKKNEDEQTPLYLASKKEDGEDDKNERKSKIARLLIQNGADPEIKCGPKDLTPGDFQVQSSPKSIEGGKLLRLSPSKQRKEEGLTREQEEKVSDALITILGTFSGVKKRVKKKLSFEDNAPKDSDELESPRQSFFSSRGGSSK